MLGVVKIVMEVMKSGDGPGECLECKKGKWERGKKGKNTLFFKEIFDSGTRGIERQQRRLSV
jgi:hypothetical protein